MIQIPENLALPRSLITDLERHFDFIRGSVGVVQRGDTYGLILEEAYANYSHARLQQMLWQVSHRLCLVWVSKPYKAVIHTACWVWVKYGEPPPIERLPPDLHQRAGLWSYEGSS